MKQVFRFFLGVLVIFLFQQNVLGAEASKAGPALRIGVIDIQVLQKDSSKFQKTKAALVKELDSLQQKLDKERESLRQIEDEFKKQNMMLSLDAKEDKQRELKKKQRYVKYIYEDFSEQMKEAELEAARKFGQELKELVRKIAQQENLLLVFEKGTPGLIVYDDVVDITDKVTKAYDQSKEQGPEPKGKKKD